MKEEAHGQTAVMFAAALDRADVVKLLIERGADPNVTTKSAKLERVRFDQDGNVIPVTAAGGRRGGAAAPAGETRVPGSGRGGSAGDVAAQVRQVGPSFMGGMTALLYAARDGQANAVRALVEGGADVNKASDGEDESPLVMAISNGHLELAKYLLDHGANPNLVGVAGLAPLYATIDVQWAPHAWFPQPGTEQEKVSYLDLMKALIAKGANVDAKLGKKIWFRSFTHDVTWIDPAGATAFWRAAQAWDLPAMHLLIDAGANPKIVSNAGDTALMAAAGIGWGANFTVNAPLPCLRRRQVLRGTRDRRERGRRSRLYGAARRRVSGQQRHGELPGVQRRQGGREDQGRRYGRRYGQRPHALRLAASGNPGAARKVGLGEFAQLPLRSMPGGAARRYRGRTPRRRGNTRG